MHKEIQNRLDEYSYHEAKVLYEKAVENLAQLYQLFGAISIDQ